MKRIRQLWRQTLRPLWHDWQWPVVGLAAAAVLVLGILGFHRHLRIQGKPIESLDLVFRSFQLFVLQIGVDPPMPATLNAARLLAPLIAAYTALQALAELFTEQFSSFHLRFLRRHAVLCGLGRKGLTLARGLLDQGQAVVVIEQDAENDYIGPCRDLGAIVLVGDSTEPWLLRKAGIAHATHLFALCDDDGINAEIAINAARIDRKRADPLHCVLHILDPRLCALLHERSQASPSQARIRLAFFNVYELGAQILLEQHPLRPISPRTGPASSPVLPHLIIVGIGALGECLLVQAARRWHLDGHSAWGPLPVTLIDRDATRILEILLVRYPALHGTCTIEKLDLDVHAAAFQEAAFLDRGSAGPDSTRVFVCLDDDSLSLTAALALARKPHSSHPTIAVRMAQEAGLAVLLREGAPATRSFPDLRAFGLLDRACHPDHVLRGFVEHLARAIHENHVRDRELTGARVEDDASMLPWDQLPESVQEANRTRAADIGAKLERIQCGIFPLLDWREPVLEITAGEIETLAREEHESWRLALLREGWRPGPHDPSARTRPDLIPFEQLEEPAKEKVRAVCRAIPRMLAKAGFQIRRLSAPNPPLSAAPAT